MAAHSFQRRSVVFPQRVNQQRDRGGQQLRRSVKLPQLAVGFREVEGDYGGGDVPGTKPAVAQGLRALQHLLRLKKAPHLRDKIGRSGQHLRGVPLVAALMYAAEARTHPLLSSRIVDAPRTIMATSTLLKD